MGFGVLTCREITAGKAMTKAMDRATGDPLALASADQRAIGVDQDRVESLLVLGREIVVDDDELNVCAKGARLVAGILEPAQIAGDAFGARQVFLPAP